ncbi:MAG TPA: hypothetical protein VMU88_03470 [bacterium]|nr:hypothetical protein [bacterium]
MCVERKPGLRFLLAAVLMLAAGRAAAQDSTPTPSAVSVSAGEAAPEGAARVRISDNVGFYYFVSAGYLVSDDSKVPSLGKVTGDFQGKMIFGTPQKVYVRLVNALVKPGDFLVVYRIDGNVEEAQAGFVGERVRNLAILQIEEVQADRCLAVVKESFGPFREGDLVKSYGDEILRWKQAQHRKLLPSKPIHCQVADGTDGMEHYAQNQWVILTAGQKDGVVEGQMFKLRQSDSTGFLSEPVHDPLGDAQVFYAGPNYSIAQILRCSEPIKKGFEAWYQP